MFEYRCRAARLLQWREKIGKSLENRSADTHCQSLSTFCKQELIWTKQEKNQISAHYLLRTWSETYLALKFSIMARLAWSISFWARPRRLWERFTAWKTQIKGVGQPNIYLWLINPIYLWSNTCNINTGGGVWGVSCSDSPGMWCVHGVHHLGPPPWEEFTIVFWTIIT